MASDQVPGKPQTQPILIRGGDVYTVSGDVLRGGWVLLDGGKITGVGEGNAPETAKGTRVIEAKGKRVYPGLFAVANELGLVEIPSVRATRDAAESGQFNPNVRVETGVNPDSELIPVTRANGVLLNLTSPAGGLISGAGAVMQLDGWTWEEMTLRSQAAMFVAWPRMSAGRSARGGDDAPAAGRPRAEDQIRQLEQFFEEARAYAAARKTAGDEPTKQAFDARLDAMSPVLDGKTPIFVWADEIRQIESAVAFSTRQKVKLVIVGGYDAPRCAELLKTHKVPVVILGTQRLPQRRDAGYDEPFTLPERLRQAGVGFCISFGGRFGSNIRNLPYHAGMAAAHGLPPAEALKAITLYPAQITGVADRVGSIEKGKDATLLIADGDILETATNVEQAFIQGRAVDLTSRHTQLWDKYRKKYEK